MAASESSETDWQLSKNSLKERNKYMFNNSLISDVSFSVKDSSADQQRSLLIPAHKYVLAISSPVFFAMFYGQMPHTSRTVDLPDCDAHSFMELLRFVYYDEAKLTGSNVIQVLYLAKKYMIPALSDECSRFLHENLDANNVFAVLPGAQAYEEAGLVEKCWDTLDEGSEEAMKSEAFLDISHDLLKAVLERDSLSSNEVEVFKAVDRWVEHQCDKTERQTTGEDKRRILGDAIKLVRFPLMTEKKFAEIVPSTNLLTKEDMCDIFLHFNGAVKTLSSYSYTPRALRGTTRRIKRFTGSARPPMGTWSYHGGADALGFCVNRDVYIRGVRLFGSKGGQYSVTIGVYQQETGGLFTELEGTFDTDKDISDDYYGFDVTFEQPAVIEKNKTYEIRAVITGPQSYYTENGQKEVITDELTRFSFSDVETSDNGTDSKRGQFPGILFT